MPDGVQNSSSSADDNGEGEPFSARLATALASVWVGLDSDAEGLRQAFNTTFQNLLMRADSVTGGKSSKQLARLHSAYLKQVPSSVRIAEHSSADEWAMHEVSRFLLRFMPDELRSLEKLIENALGGSSPKAQQKRPNRPHSSPSTFDDDAELRRKEISRLALSPDALLPPVSLMAGWPGQKKLAEIVEKAIDALAKQTCPRSLVDINFWRLHVPMMAGASFATAAAIQVAFQAANVTGLSKSDKELGREVHDRVASAAARKLSARSDCYLVAEENVHLPGRGGRIVPLHIQAETNAAAKEYSLRVLIQSRKIYDWLPLRAKNTKSSREDLVVFFAPGQSLVPLVLGTGRPEVYEVKPVDSIIGAVAQVTAYSFNYLLASTFHQCVLLPGKPLSRLDNPLMLPASPELHTLLIPTLSVTRFATIATGPMNIAAAAASVTQLVEEFATQAFSIPPKIVVPFMVTGLYGVIPYFVLDMGKLAGAAEEAIKIIIESLIAALLAYLLAKKLAETMGELATEFAKALGKVLTLLLEHVVLIVAAVLLVCALVAAAPAEGVLLGAGALILLIGTTPEPPKQNSVENPPMTLKLGPLEAQGLTATQFASAATQMRSYFEKFFSDFPPPPPGGSPVVVVTPLG